MYSHAPTRAGLASGRGFRNLSHSRRASCLPVLGPQVARQRVAFAQADGGEDRVRIARLGAHARDRELQPRRRPRERRRPGAEFDEEVVAGSVLCHAWLSDAVEVDLADRAFGEPVLFRPAQLFSFLFLFLLLF